MGVCIGEVPLIVQLCHHLCMWCVWVHEMGGSLYIFCKCHYVNVGGPVAMGNALMLFSGEILAGYYIVASIYTSLRLTAYKNIH